MKSYYFTVNGNNYFVDILHVDENVVSVEVNGKSYDIEIDTPISKPVVVTASPKVVKFAPTPPPKAAPATAEVNQIVSATTSGSVIKSPLPGVVIDIFVRTGDLVKTGQRILMLEAMKMENNIDADKDGVVKEIRVNRDDSVMEGDILVIIG